MFDKYLEKILPIPLVNIEHDKTGYVYRITTYSRVADECRNLEKRILKNKKIKSFNGWWFKDNDTFYKQAIVEFNNG